MTNDKSTKYNKHMREADFIAGCSVLLVLGQLIGEEGFVTLTLLYNDFACMRNFQAMHSILDYTVYVILALNTKYSDVTCSK